MTGKIGGQKWIAPAVMAVLSLVIALVPSVDRSTWTIPVLVMQLILPVAAAMTGALYGWPVTAAVCVLAAVAGWKAFPAEAGAIRSLPLPLPPSAA